MKPHLVPIYEPRTAAEVYRNVKEVRARMAASEIARTLELNAEVARARAERIRREAEMARAHREKSAALKAEREKIAADEEARRASALERLGITRSGRDIIDYSKRDTPHEYLALLCAERGVDVADIVGASRVASVLSKRHAIIFDMKQRFPDLSSVQIGKMFFRDHTTILNSLMRESKRRGLT